MFLCYTVQLGKCKEQLKKEAAAKNEALEQTQTINQLLNLKTQVSFCYIFKMFGLFNSWIAIANKPSFFEKMPKINDIH